MKRYITTSIAYTNAPPHIGFALELIQADAYARYCRSKGEELFFLTGTDEHGLKIAQKAKEVGKGPKEFCDELSSIFKSLTRELSLSNDDFIRTTDREKHWPGVKKLWQTIKANGDIYEKEYQGRYCVGCEAFIRDKDLVDGKCPYHKREPEIVSERNYFFRLSNYSDKIADLLESGELKIIPTSRKNEVLSLIRDGLEDLSISRPKEKIEWGIPVPDDESQLIYVWGDALTNYISAIGYGRDEDSFNEYWPADIHFIGKDILRFHALIWPGLLLSAGLPLPRKIFVHGFLTINGEKISKSLGNVIDPFELIEEYGSDPVRYFFLREMAPTEDGDFSYDKFKERYNADLASGLGNLVSRVITLSSGVKAKEATLSIDQEIKERKRRRDEAFEQLRFNSAAEEVWKLISFADKYIEENRPWEKREGWEVVVGDLIIILKAIAELVEPFMPKTSVKILEQIESQKKENLFSRI